MNNIKKILFATLLSISSIMLAVAQNTVTVSSAEGAPGAVVNIDVVLQNSDGVTAAEFVFPLAEKQLVYVDGSCEINAERADGHQISAAAVDGNLKVYVYGLSVEPLKGNDGRLFSFSLKLGKSPAVYALQPQVILSDAQGDALPVTANEGAVTILAPQAEAVTQTIDFGHVPIRSQFEKTLTLRNCGTTPLDVTDIVASSDVFSVSEKVFTIPAGEAKSVNVVFAPVERGAVEETVTVVSNAVNGSVTARLVADPYSVNELHSGTASGIAGEEVTVELRMNNMEPIVGLQSTFTLPEQLEYVEGSFAPAERASSHTALATCADGKLTVLLYSSKNIAIGGDDGVVATFRLRLTGYSGYYHIAPENAVLSNAALENMTSAVSGNSIRISSPAIGGNSELDMGNTPVTEVAMAEYVVKNNGNAPLVVSSVAFLAEGYRVTNELPMTIGAYSSGTLNVEYTPAEEGEHSVAMNIYSNDPVNKLKSVKVGGDVYEPNSLLLEGENLQNGNYVLSVGLDNYTGIVALQMDIHWMPGMTTSNALLNVTERLGAHSCSVTKLDEDSYRFIAFSFGNSVVGGNSGKLFDLTFVPEGGVDYKDTPILIDNVVMSNDMGQDYTSQLSVSTNATFNNFSVRFVCDGEVIGEQFLRAGDDVVAINAPRKPAYSFVEWSGLPEIMPAADIEVEAVYERVYEVEVTVNQYGSGTYCSEHPLDFSEVTGLKAYAATGYNSYAKEVTLTRVKTANDGVGLFIMGTPGKYTVPVIEHSYDNSLNMLVGTMEKVTLNSVSDCGKYANYKYTIKSGMSTPMFYQFSDGSSYSAWRAYLQIPVEWLYSSQSKSIGIRFDEGETTDIGNLGSCDEALPVYYDLNGRAVLNPESGVYILNGKKVLINK